mmetsp:Transcript_24935/g.55263  ORF Transcript_24935/g.55263 Transcript_24935/m.55263 type:complete len:807 (+) Transcript_24935:322-2742(+)
MLNRLLVLPRWLFLLAIRVSLLHSSTNTNTAVAAFGPLRIIVGSGVTRGSATGRRRQQSAPFIKRYRRSSSPVRDTMEQSTSAGKYSVAPVGSDDCYHQPSSDPYAYVDESIKSVLTADPSTHIGSNTSSTSLLVDASTLRILYDNMSPLCSKGSISLDDLVLLACQCESIVFRPNHCSENDNRADCDAAESLHPSVLRPSVQELLPNRLSNLLCIVTDKDQESWEVEPQILVATLISFNMLESKIRDLCNKTSGRAPLLKHMIESLGRMGDNDDGAGSVGEKFRSLSAILRTLLLPSGINLRNLVWHGFLATIPRKWLALNVCLMLSLEEADLDSRDIDEPSSDTVTQSDAVRSSLERVAKLSMHEGTRSMMEYGQVVMESDDGLLHHRLVESVSSIVPASHRSLLRVAVHRYARHYPVCFAAISSLIIEHSLRLLWCEENRKPEDMIALRGYDRYYVTLDGHGQRDKHDIVLMPYLSTEDADGSQVLPENRLVQRLGGSALAFLSDMFTSPHGPNIRSAVTHGIWDDFLYEELGRMVEGNADDTGGELRGVAFALLASLDLLSFANEASSFPPRLQKLIRPAFSYAAIMTREVEVVLEKLVDLDNTVTTEQVLIASSSANMSSQYIKALSLLSSDLDVSRLAALKERIVPTYDYETASIWSVSDVYKESGFNTELAQCRAACALINDLALALSQMSDTLADAMATLSKGGDRRQCKKATRLCSVVPLALQLYKVAAYAALFQIETEKSGVQNESSTDAMKAVERSRMCISTFATMLNTNIDRSVKAAADYASSKTVMSLIKTLQ